MNKTIEGFMKRAADAGLTKEQAESFIAREFGIQNKTAAQALDEIVTDVLKFAGVKKNEKTAAYVQGMMNAATEKGMDINKAAEFAATAVAQNTNFEKEAAVAPAPEELGKQAAYTEGFMKAAQESGYSIGQGLDLLNFVVKNSGALNPNTKSANADLLSLLQSGHIPPELLQHLLGGGGGQGGGQMPQMGGGQLPQMPQMGGMGSMGQGGDMFKNLPN